MIVQVLTDKKHFEWVMEEVYEYREYHDIRVSTQPYVIIDEYDIGISFMHQYKVPKEQIEHRPWINFHPGPLPEYKGRNLCYHAIMNGETEFGTTIHYMDENFDTGDIIEVVKFSIDEWDTAESLSELAIHNCMVLFCQYLPRILNGEIFETTKNVGGAYYKKANIAEVVSLDKDIPLSRFIRAVYYPPYYPKFEIGGVMYKIVKDE
jgi:methionyl-tRNA formyltransferase